MGAVTTRGEGALRRSHEAAGHEAPHSRDARILPFAQGHATLPLDQMLLPAEALALRLPRGAIPTVEQLLEAAAEVSPDPMLHSDELPECVCGGGACAYCDSDIRGFRIRG